MGDWSQIRFVEDYRSFFRGPILEVGSHDYGTTPPLRTLFPGESYTGVDLFAGKGVDRIIDLTDPFEEVDRALGGGRFNSIFCSSVLEHCQDPFGMAANITLLLKPRGMLYVSVPFAWKVHDYPADYWRFTPQGIERLFPRIHFDPTLMLASSPRSGEFYSLVDDLGRIGKEGPRWRGPGSRFKDRCESFLTRLLIFIGTPSWLRRYRYVLAPTLIHMVGSCEPD